MTPDSNVGRGALDKLVERQMRNWELSRGQRLSVPQEQRPDVEEFITISRTVGAGGYEIATHLGSELGWPVFDKEILQEMAGDDALRQQVYASMDERDLGWCEELLRSLWQPEFVKNDYFRRLTQTVLSIARQGHAVFLGRGTDLILPRDRGFRLRLVRSRESTVRSFASTRHLTPTEALEEVARIETERGEFIRRYFQVDPDEPTRWDLTMNLERLSARQVVNVILSLREELADRG